MDKENQFYFNRLKKEVTAFFLKEHHASSNIHDWKGEEIALFQEDLFVKVKAKVSEKWFYTYFKNDYAKLPRIDMLNLLSRYVGYANWQDFKNDSKNKVNVRSKRKYAKYLVLIGVFILIFLGFFLKSKNSYNFCFVDSLTDEAITHVPLSIKVLKKDVTPLYFKTDSLGCFTYETNEDYITFVVSSPYHKTDTIVRSHEGEIQKRIQVATDDYALMLHYYTTGNIEGWEKHRNRLENLIDDDAVIYQLYSKSIRVELYSKDDFIQMISIPTSNLRRVQILDKTMKEGKIIKLKFILL